MMDVTPQIPDGPVVQAFQRLVGKQKLDAEIARQKKLMGPLLDRGDAKVQAKKKELSMLAEVEIKNRLGKRELALKRKDKEDNRAEHARQEAAKARRLERYEKWSQDEVKRNQERLGKLHSHTSTAFDMAKQLFKRAPSSKKTAVESMAKASAKQRQELTVGGFLGLKGDQINFDALSDLNDKIAKAMKVPDDGNINFVEAAYDQAATAVAEEQASFKRKEGSWKEKANKVQEEKEKEQIQKHNVKLDELRTKVQKESTVKGNRKDKIETDRLANEQAEKGRWRAAFEDIKKKRQAISDGEATEKNKFLYTLGVKEVAKKNKAPGEMATAKAKKLTEREEKVLPCSRCLFHANLLLPAVQWTEKCRCSDSVCCQTNAQTRLRRICACSEHCRDVRGKATTCVPRQGRLRYTERAGVQWRASLAHRSVRNPYITSAANCV